MFKSTSRGQSNQLRLLCNQLDSLKLVYSNGAQRTTTTRITPRGPRRRPMKVYKIIYWHKSKMFPPNWKNDHHIFYPSLKEVLLKKRLDEYNPENFINVGIEYSRRGAKTEREKRKDLKPKKLATKQDLLDLVNLKSSDIDFDYELYNQRWLCSEEGMKETLRLAEHYDLFRSIFHIQRPEARPTKKVDFDDLFPRPEQIYESDVMKYYPGAIKFNTNERDDVYFFNPVVPVYAEFVNKDDELSPVIRGNLIEPAYAANKPNIVLDTNYFTETATNKPYEQLVEDGQAVLTGQDEKYYSVALLNLDNVFLDQKPTCHYLVSNIKGNEQEESISYLPVYGVKGLGYQRYAFLVFRHDQKLNIDKVNDFDLNKRSFNVLDFIRQHDLKPVGLSWFQSQWDSTCKDLFHNVLKTRMPVYEYIQNEEIKNKQIKIPAPASFNNYLDRYRDTKELSKEVLVERLNKLDPFDCEKAIEEPDLPANIYKIPWDTPSWLKGSMWKRSNRLGRFRGLRAPSALKPHNNNEDLDKPMWPHPDKVDLPMRYPFQFRQVRPLREGKWAVPPDQRPALIAEESYDVPNIIKQEADKIYELFKIVDKKDD